MCSPVIFPAPVLNPFLFLKFEITQVWPIFLFMLSVCIFPCSQVGDAWREGEGLSLRQPCLSLAPHFTRGSWVGKQGLKGPECTKLLSERWLCTHWPYYNIYSFQANAKQQSLQQAGSHSGAGAGEFAFCICWCSCCWCSCVSGYLYFLFSPVFDPHRGQQEMARWEGKPVWARAWHMCENLFTCACWSAWVEQIAWPRVFWKCLVFGMYRFFLLAFIFLKKINYVKHIYLPISHGFTVVLHWSPCILCGFTASSPAKCSGSLPDRSAHFLPSLPSPSMSASWASTDQRRVLFYF